jgi:hypothetical protein
MRHRICRIASGDQHSRLRRRTGAPVGLPWLDATSGFDRHFNAESAYSVVPVSYDPAIGNPGDFFYHYTTRQAAFEEICRIDGCGYHRRFGSAIPWSPIQAR